METAFICSSELHHVHVLFQCRTWSFRVTFCDSSMFIIDFQGCCKIDDWLLHYNRFILHIVYHSSMKIAIYIIISNEWLHFSLQLGSESILKSINKYDIRLWEHALSSLALRVPLIPSIVLTAAAEQSTPLRDATSTTDSSIKSTVPQGLNPLLKEYIGIFRPPGHKGPFWNFRPLWILQLFMETVFWGFYIHSRSMKAHMKTENWEKREEGREEYSGHEIRSDLLYCTVLCC